jgi:hypothetical protein
VNKCWHNRRDVPNNLWYGPMYRAGLPVHRRACRAKGALAVTVRSTRSAISLGTGGSPALLSTSRITQRYSLTQNSSASPIGDQDAISASHLRASSEGSSISCRSMSRVASCLPQSRLIDQRAVYAVGKPGGAAHHIQLGPRSALTSVCAAQPAIATSFSEVSGSNGLRAS